MACDGSGGSGKPNPYSADELWMCKPGIEANRCLELDQTATFIYSDLSHAVFEHTPATDPAFDCFYVYPTVDTNEVPGNTEDLTDDTPVLPALYNQAARFTELCNVYAPLYRQINAGTYDLGNYRDTEFYEIAFNDVSQAFDRYLKESGSRPFTLIGHSQGSHMLLELLAQRFENNAKLRQRLISVLAIGSLGRLNRPDGAIVPDSFENIPLCHHASETGCIITFDTIVAGDLERVADSRPCVDPTRLGGNPGLLASDLWWENSLPFPEGIETPFAGEPDFYTANCEADGYLGIGIVEGDDRNPFIPPEVIQAVTGGTLHVADFNYAMGDLLRIVSTQAENMP
jgi:hypothetical protein